MDNLENKISKYISEKIIKHISSQQHKLNLFLSSQLTFL